MWWIASSPGVYAYVHTRRSDVQWSIMVDHPSRPGSETEPTIGVRDLRAGLAAHLDRVEAGETIIVRRGGRSIARLCPLSELSGRPAGYTLEDLARLGVVERPRITPSSDVTGGPEQSRRSAPPLPVDVRVDRIVRHVRG